MSAGVAKELVSKTPLPYAESLVFPSFLPPPLSFSLPVLATLFDSFSAFKVTRMLTFPGRCWITVKSVYFRITLTRFTLAFFLFCFIHCFAEGFIQAFLFTLDADANSLASSILHQAQVPRSNFGVLTRHNGNATLELCNLIPTYVDNPPCEAVYQTGRPNLPLPSEFNIAVRSQTSRNPTISQLSVRGTRIYSSLESRCVAVPGAVSVLMHA